MAKKKRSSKGVSFPGDDATSCASSYTQASLNDNASPGQEDSEEFVDPFERCLESLYEKRASTRVSALSELVDLLEKSYCYEDCLFRQESVTRMLLTSLRKGASSEAILAVRALGLHILTLGLSEDVQRLLQEVSLALQTTATAGGKDAGLRSAALEALSLLTFAAEEDDMVTDCIMEGLLKIAASEAKPQIQAAALRGWSLLLTTLPSVRLDGAFCSRVLQSLSKHLLPEDVEVRDAAGEAIALVFSIAGLAGLGEEGGDAPPQEAADSGPGSLEELVQRMRELATNRGDERRRSKRDRASLKSSFREHCKAVEGEHMAFEKLKLQNNRLLVIDSLEGQVQLNAVRKFLGTGLQPQLEANELLRDIFGLGAAEIDDGSDEAGGRYSRAPDSATQKRRSLVRGRQQSQKASRASWGTGDCDDGY